MNNIKPIYVIFEQAKLLKDKEFEVECVAAFDEVYPEKGNVNSHRRKSLNWNRKSSLRGSATFISKPEQWQVVEWLRVNHGIWIQVISKNTTTKMQFKYEIKKYELDGYITDESLYNSPQEAYSAAFDYVLKELI